MPYESIYLNKGVDKKIKSGVPWVFLDEISSTAKLPLLDVGQLVNIVDMKGVYVATAYYDPLSKIAFRVLSYRSNEKIDQKFFNEKLAAALERRDYIKENFYRLFYSESDGISGLIIDRYGDYFYVKIGAKGLEKYLDLIIESLKSLKPNGIYIKKIDAVEIIGSISDTLEVIENDTIYFCSLKEGQKTGWYFDQRENHKMIADISSGKRVLDVFCYNGGFGVIAGKHSAKEVTFVDSSQKAVEFCQQAILANTITCKAKYIQEDALDAMEGLANNDKKFDVIILDPPPFIKKKKDKPSGIKGYEKLLEAALPLLEEGGVVFFCTCSYHMQMSDLLKLIQQFSSKNGRKAEVLRKTSQAKDHPVHSQLPQTRYLNGVLFMFI